MKEICGADERRNNLTGRTADEKLDVNNIEQDTEVERTNKEKSGHRLGGTLSGVTGHEDEMDVPSANKGRTDEELDLTVGNAAASLEAPDKIII
jgi:hypothetical protein